MRGLSIAVVLAVAAGAAHAQVRRSGVAVSEAAVSADRMPRLGNWVKAVDRHEPGESDDALEGVAAWGNTQLRGVWGDGDSLAQLMRNPRTAHCMVKPEGTGNAA